MKESMTDTQLYLAIGLPTLALVLGMIGNGLLFNALSTRISGVGSTLSARMIALETRIDLLISKVADIDGRLSVLEDRSQRG
jgi:hypothetical protein